MNKFHRKIKTFTSLSKEEKHLFIRTFFLLIRIRLLMIFIPFQGILTKINHWTPSVGAAKSIQAVRICWMIESVAYTLPWLFTCLPRALTGFILCRKNGWDVVLRIGARRRKKNAPLEAHAWLEWEGKILIGMMPDIEKYAVFDSFQGRFLGSKYDQEE